MRNTVVNIARLGVLVRLITQRERKRQRAEKDFWKRKKREERQREKKQQGLTSISIKACF